MTALDPRAFQVSSRLLDYWSDYLRANPGARATVDFETRSACDIKRHGSYLYSRHPSTQAMCMSYKLPGDDHVRRWHMAHPQHLVSETPPPVDLFAFIEAGGLVEAHNAFFERVIWENVMVPQHGWPEMPVDQWRCSAARASACAIPRDLEGACEAMRLDVRKNMEGRRLMLKMSKPRKPRKAEIEVWMARVGVEGDYRRKVTQFTEANGYLWHEDEQDLYHLWDYCDDDVVAEEALSESLPDLSPEELEVWQIDQAMNMRGVRFDLDMARSALDLAARYKERLNAELVLITGDDAMRATRREAVKEWLCANEDLNLPDTAADTLDHYKELPTLSDRAKRVLEIVREANRTSTRKYQAMLDKCDEHGVARDLLMYHGAGTGRWAGKSIQVHNFPARELVVKDFECAAEVIKLRDAAWAHVLYGDVMRFLSHALRGTIVPSPGRRLAVADYSAIEARCVLWEAGSEAALEVFRQGGDIYCDMATGIYGYPVTRKNKDERQFGKQAILGLGYQMGFITFLLTCRKYGIRFSLEDCVRIMGREALAERTTWVRRFLCLDPMPVASTPEERQKQKAKLRQAARTARRFADIREDIRDVVHELALMKHTVDVYRGRYPEVKDMWSAQEAAAIEAVQSWSYMIEGAETQRARDAVVGPSVHAGPVRWQALGGFLHCFLPSGRPIRYRDPEIKEVPTTWGTKQPALRYMSVDGVTRQWTRTATYGGKLVENITQGVARDIMAAAFVRAHHGGIYMPLMSVHDELVCDVDKDLGDADEFERLMIGNLAWAKGCPVAAEAEILSRYKK